MIEISYLEEIPSSLPINDDNLPRFHHIKDQLMAINPNAVLVARTYWGILMSQDDKFSTQVKILELILEGNIVVNTIWEEDICNVIMFNKNTSEKVLIAETREKEVVND